MAPVNLPTQDKRLPVHLCLRSGRLTSNNVLGKKIATISLMLVGPISTIAVLHEKFLVTCKYHDISDIHPHNFPLLNLNFVPCRMVFGYVELSKIFDTLKIKLDFPIASSEAIGNNV